MSLISSKQTPHVHFGMIRTSIESSAARLIASNQLYLSSLDPRVILDSLKKPDSACRWAADGICAWAKKESRAHHISEKVVYKILLRQIKKYDLDQKPYKDTGIQQESTFALRNSFLIASQKSHVQITSAEVFTKAVTMPGNKWGYLDRMDSWIPEEQRVMGKWVESNMVKCLELGKQRRDDDVILLKGGFGAGKTQLIKEMLEEYGPNMDSSVVAPDKAKEVVRRYIPKMPHHIAHDQGSAISYKFFNQMMTMPGTIVYDSALKDPSDLQKYIEKAEAAGKKVVVYDVARLDVLRALAVLKRPVFGEDPRIPPEFVISGAVDSKLSRIECMQKILQSTPGAGHEYRFRSGDEHGSNMQEILRIKNNRVSIEGGIDKCLELEHLAVKDDHLILTATKSELTEEIRQQLNGSVRGFVALLQGNDQELYRTIFAERTIAFKELPKDTILTIGNLYESLESKFTEHMSKSDFMSALSKTPMETQAAFIQRCNVLLQAKGSISYLDFPLYTALAIHANLQEDPWKS